MIGESVRRGSLACLLGLLLGACPLAFPFAIAAPAPESGPGHGNGFLVPPHKPPSPKAISPASTVARLPAVVAPGRPPALTIERAPALRPRLIGLYQALEQLETGRRTQPILLLQIGDSHTANDAFSGRMRELFQQRFGDGGRGLLPAGIAFKSYNPAQVQVQASPGWTLVNSFDSSTTGPFGLSGLRQHTDAADETMVLTLASAPDASAAAATVQAAAQLLGGTRPAQRPTGVMATGGDRATVELMRQPGGGRVQVEANGRPIYTRPTDARQPSIDWITLAVPPGTRTLSLKTLDRKPVDVLSWSLGRRAGGGVQWANHGTIGATVNLISHWDPSVVALEMRQLQPSLITVAFGTNEGFQDATDIDAYSGRYAAALGVLRAGWPSASLAIMGPPDGNRAVNAGGSAPSTCVPHPADPASSAPNWTIPVKLPQVRAVQARLAELNGAFYFDWSAAMGGPCSMHRWTELQPPLGQPDHVHLRAAGYRQTAEVMFREMMEGYDSWKAARRRR